MQKLEAQRLYWLQALRRMVTVKVGHAAGSPGTTSCMAAPARQLASAWASSYTFVWQTQTMQTLTNHSMTGYTTHAQASQTGTARYHCMPLPGTGSLAEDSFGHARRLSLPAISQQ